MTRDDLMDSMRDAAIVAARANGRKLAVSRMDMGAALDVVLDQVLALSTPVLEREWSGNAVLGPLLKLRGGRR